MFIPQSKEIRSTHTILRKKTDEKTPQLIERLKELEKQIIPMLNQWIEKNLSGTLEIASYYDMCGNCQATFRHDFDIRKHVARTIFILFINTIQAKKIEDLIWCLKGWIYDPPKSGLTLSMPKISLIVSSLEKYGDQNDD